MQFCGPLLGVADGHEKNDRTVGHFVFFFVFVAATGFLSEIGTKLRD